MTPFVIYQGAWNLMERSFEREIIPMARSEGDYRFVPRKATDVKKKKRHGSCPLARSYGWKNKNRRGRRETP